MASSMSDEELQRKLKDFGEPVIPVTDTTRKTLIAKLKKLESGRSDAPRRKSLLSFSSDESENEAKGSRRNNNDSKASAILPAAVNVTVRRSRRSKGGSVLNSSLTFSKDENDVKPFVQPRSPVRRSLTSVDLGKAIDKRMVKSPSAPSELPASAIFTRQRRSLNVITKSTRSGVGTTSAATLDPDTSGSDSDLSDNSISNIPENTGVNEFPRSRRSLIAVTPPYYNSLARERRGEPADYSSPSSWKTSSASTAASTLQDYISNSKKSPSPAISKTNKATQQHLNGHHDVIDSVNDSFDRSFSAETPPNNSQCISMILLGILALFFLIVGLIYLGARHKDLMPAPGPEHGDIRPVCTLDSNWNCITDERVDHTYDASVYLNGVLRGIAGEAECNARSLPSDRRMSSIEAGRHLRAYVKDGPKVNLDDVFLIFFKNPHWRIRLMNATGAPVQSVDFLHEVAWLESLVPSLSLFCRMTKAFQNTVYKVSLGLAVAMIIIAFTVLVYWFWDRKRRTRREIFALVEKILEILQNHQRACRAKSELQPFLAVPHVRDMLIPLAERKTKRAIWEAAVHFIQNNDSRVRFETQTLEGEDFLVWRWLPHDTPNSCKTGNKSVRVWQGQAFENLDTGMNALPCSPTPCLKVRNMFDADIEYEDNWPTHIRDAILEKCSGASIMHLKVDPSSKEGCVYIKCKNPETAGKVYKELHGWWFDGKLVTVKYLRLERYHERFPEAIVCSRPLLPSTASEPLVQSSLHGRRLRSSIGN